MTNARTIPRLVAGAIAVSLPWVAATLSGSGREFGEIRAIHSESRGEFGEIHGIHGLTPQQPAIALPEGGGKRLVERFCSECHDPSLVMFTREDQDGWAVIVNDMGARGAKAKPEELQAITSYLAEHFNRDGKSSPFASVGAGAATARDEPQLFAAGKEIYGALCVACHQPDGRGRDKVAPPLVGSQLTLAPPPVPVRIMLHGKRGPANVMPALGSLLSDEQIAAVLTYVRREWGQTAAAVDAATVKEIRGQTAGRARPWTAEELSQIK